MIAGKKSNIQIIMIFVGFIFLFDVNSIIQPTDQDYFKFNYLNCTNRTQSNTKNTTLFHGVNLYTHTPFGYINPQPNLCRGKVDVLLYIQTSLNHFSRRKLIRQTYGSLQTVHGKRLILLFVVGVRPENKLSQEKLETELSDYHDIVQANFYDSYRNLTIKHLVMLDWVSNFCSHAQFILKTDDDVYVNPFTLVATLYYGKFNHTEPFLLGRLYSREIPCRNRTLKWYTTDEEYPEHFGLYPPHMRGYGYIMSQAAIKPLWFCSYFRPYLFIDDVFITGLVTKLMDYYVKLYNLDKEQYSSTRTMSEYKSTQLPEDYVFLMGETMNITLWNLAWRNSLRSSHYVE